MKTSSETPILQVKGLTIYYDSFRAVHEVSFDVNAGEIFGLLGPNGAGKTSTLSAIEGLLKQQSGDVIIAGYNTKDKPLYARANIGVQLQATSFQTELDVADIIELYAGIYGVEMSNEKMKSMLADIKLTEVLSKRYGQLSGGQQQRLSLFIAMIHNPNLVLLDEPTSGLDPQSRRQLW